MAVRDLAMRKRHVAIVAACPFSADRGTPIRITGMSETLTARGHRISDVTDHLEMDAPISGIDVHRTPDVGGVAS